MDVGDAPSPPTQGSGHTVRSDACEILAKTRSMLGLIELRGSQQGGKNSNSTEAEMLQYQSRIKFETKNRKINILKIPQHLKG